MEFTGLVRRIDNLGRIVIPKEIRSHLKLKCEDCLEISVQNDMIILKKKSLLNGCEKFLEDIVDVLHRMFKTNIVITDNDKIVCSCGNLVKKIRNDELSSDIYKMIFNRKRVVVENTKFIGISNVSYLLQPIIVNGDTIGSVLIIRDEAALDNSDFLCIELINALMIKNLEV